MILELLFLGTLAVKLWQASPTPTPGKKEAKPFATRAEERVVALFGNARREQMREIMFGGEDEQPGPAELVARKNLKVAFQTLGTAIVGALIFPPLRILSAIGFLYLTRHLFREAYRAAVQEKRISIYILHSAVMIAVVIGRFFFAGAVTACFIMFTRLLVVKTEDHSRRKLVNLFGQQHRMVWVQLEEGKEMQIPIEKVLPGQILVLNAGETIPVDGTILKGNASIDEHMLTGEFRPSEKTQGQKVFTCTTVLSGRISVQVEKAGTETVASQIAQALERTMDYKTKLRSDAAAFVDKLTIPMFAVGAVAYPIVGFSSALGILWNVPGVRMEFFGPLSMLNFLHLASKEGVLIKDGRSLDLLGKMDTIVFDKTGTLTMPLPEVGEIRTYGSVTEDEVLRLAAAAEYRQTHPIAIAILGEAQRRAIDLPEIDTASYQLGYGVKVKLEDGWVRVGSLEFMALEKLRISKQVQEWQSDCHAAGSSLVLVARDRRVIGGIELRPQLRPEAREVVARLRARNLMVCILSGDHETPTRALAEELGIETYFAGTLPEHKADRIKLLQADGHKVCLVGDGINDAIALKQADLSVSLRGATSIAMDTAQIVLMDGSLNHLPRLMALGDEYSKNMRANYLISIVPSAICMVGAFVLRWSFLTSAMFGLSGLVLGLRNVMKPVLESYDREKEAAQKAADAKLITIEAPSSTSSTTDPRS